MNDKFIEIEDPVELLGVQVDNKLKFNEHVSSVLKKKGNQFIHYHKFPTSGVKMPTFFIIIAEHSIKKINKFHKKALRLLYKDDNLTCQQLL